MASKKQSNSLSFRVKIFNETGIKRHRAEIVSTDANITQIRFKKPRSSKYAIKPIPTPSIVFIESGSDKGTMIGYKGRELVAEYRGLVETDKSGMLKITTEDGKTIMASPHLTEAEADDESGANDGAKKKAAPKKGKKASA